LLLSGLESIIPTLKVVGVFLETRRTWERMPLLSNLAGYRWYLEKPV
jgi:hypothetical protein